MAFSSKGKATDNLNGKVAIFHGSFHPTKGNIIDWSLKADEDIPLTNLEFSVLPSGLHLVAQDVVYFSSSPTLRNPDGYRGVAVFRRRPTSEPGHRGFRLSSLGLLVKGTEPWKYAESLSNLADTIYSQAEDDHAKWDYARRYFEQQVDHIEAGSGLELDERSPLLHLPHMARILGPSLMTLWKYVVGRKRVMIFTLPPVQASGILAYVAAGLAGTEPVNVLGMVTLMDLDRLGQDDARDGWIACTTDAIFLERPACYDLLIDLTTSTPSKTTRPTLYASKQILPSSPTTSSSSSSSITSQSRPKSKLSSVRFAWSDLKVWNELDRILQRDASHSHSCCSTGSSSSSPVPEKLGGKFITAFTDVWQVYEDVCIVCAGLWVGSGYRGNSRESYSSAGGREWGSVRLEGDDDLSLGALQADSTASKIRMRGNGIEGRPTESEFEVRMRGCGIEGRPSMGSTAPLFTQQDDGEDDDGGGGTTATLLQTLHAQAAFHVGVMRRFVERAIMLDDAVGEGEQECIVGLTAKDVAAFELGPWSAIDVKYLEWLGVVCGGGFDEERERERRPVRVVVRKGWKDVLGVVFGY